MTMLAWTDWAEWKLNWLDIPISDEAIAAVIAIKERISPPLSEEKLQQLQEQMSRLREESREEVLAEMAKRHAAPATR